MSEHAIDDGCRHDGSFRSLEDVFAPRGHHVWRDHNGQLSMHVVYGLVGCPAPITASFVLVRRDASGERTALEAGRTTTTLGSVNLARIRRRAAQLGADEVHLLPLAPGPGMTVDPDDGARDGDLAVADLEANAIPEAVARALAPTKVFEPVV